MQSGAGSLDRIIRMKEVKPYSGLGRTATLKLVSEGKFPRPIKLTDGPRGAIGWFESELIAWQKAKAVSRDKA